MALQLQIIGFLLMILAVIHVIFPVYFKWKTELSSLNLINKQLMYVHTFFVAFMVFLMGLLCVSAYEEIISTKLGHKIAFGMFVFWGCRLFFQFFVYSSALWRGKTFETIMHICFSCLWSYLTVIFFLIFWNNL